MKLQSNRNKKYYIGTLVVLAILLFFGSSRFIFSDTRYTKNSEIGSEVEKNSNKFMLVDATFYQKNGVIEVALLSESTQLSLDNELEVVAKNSENNKKLPTTLEKINDDYYVVFVALPTRKWQQVSIQLSNKSDDNILTSDIGKFYLSNSKTTKKDLFKPKNLADYEQEYYKSLLAQQDKLVESINKEIQSKNTDIANFKEKNAKLLDSVELKTAQERKEMQERIRSNEQSISTTKKAIEDLEKKRSEYEEKIEKIKKVDKK